MKRKLLLSLSAVFFMAASSFAQSDCANAGAATACAGSVFTATGSTIGALAYSEGTCTTNASTGGAHYYTMVGDGGNWDVSTDNPGTDYDTKLFVFSGSCGALTCVDGNDDGPGVSNFQSIVGTFLTTVGTTYYIIVSGFTSDEGNYELTIASDAICTGVQEDISSQLVAISPNPTSNFFNVDLGEFTGDVNYSLFSIDGRMVKAETTVNTNNFKVDLTNEGNGIYFLRIRNEANAVKTYKVIKR